MGKLYGIATARSDAEPPALVETLNQRV